MKDTNEQENKKTIDISSKLTDTDKKVLNAMLGYLYCVPPEHCLQILFSSVSTAVISEKIANLNLSDLDNFVPNDELLVECKEKSLIILQEAFTYNINAHKDLQESEQTAESQLDNFFMNSCFSEKTN